MMTPRMRSKCGVLILLLWAMPGRSQANAQEVAASFDELRFKVKAGDTVYIRPPSIRRRRFTTASR